MRKSPNYYLRNISRRWHAEIKKVDKDGKVIIICPYLTSKAEKILRGSNAKREVYTVFSVRNFVSGASSLKTLKKLYEQGCELYHLSHVHAKIIISPGKFATIGSQNVTRNGEKSKEATVIIFDKEEINKIEKMLNNWLPGNKPITWEMLKELEAQVISLRRRFNLINRELNTDMKSLEEKIWANEKEREKEREKEKKERDNESERKKERQQKINTIRTRVQQLSTNGLIELEVAQEFIRESAYWDHPNGSLVRAPKHAENIYDYNNNYYKNNYCWAVNFGVNTFLVSLAIYRCQEALLAFLEKAECGNIMSKLQLRENLKLIVQGAVSNHHGGEYRCYPANNNNCMMFGTQAINISNFVDLIINKSGIDDQLWGLIQITTV
jgi:hypothetical protein